LTRSKGWSEEMSDRGVIDDIRQRLADPREVARRLGLDGGKVVSQGGKGITICCPAHGDRTPSLSLTRGPDGTLRVRCFGCELQGDVFSLLAAVDGRTLPRDFPAVLEQAAALAGVALDDARGSTAWTQRPRFVPPPPVPPRYPPAAEVQALIEACGPCARDPEIAAELTRRKIDPVGVDRYGLAFALPLSAKLPDWAGYIGGRENAVPWTVDGYRLIVPMRGSDGKVTSVRARAVTPRPEGMPKALPASGYSSVGLVMACPCAAVMLSFGAWVGRCERRVVVSEGEPDWLTWASRGSGPRELASLGIGGAGQWTQGLADRVPDGSTVILRTDQDDAGDKYAESITASLRGRCKVLESDPPARAERRQTRPERELARRDADRARRAAERTGMVLT
jgi:hypothetical protein